MKRIISILSLLMALLLGVAYALYRVEDPVYTERAMTKSFPEFVGLLFGIDPSPDGTIDPDFSPIVLGWFTCPLPYSEKMVQDALAGNVEAQFCLGANYSSGSGVAEDRSEEASWCQKAAERGDARAQHNLGNMYTSGSGVQKDYRQAVSWYQKAAKQGLMESQYRLGLMFYNGKGVARDHQQALVWYRKAAEQGHKTALPKLGDMYDKGEGAERDIVLAYTYFSLIAKEASSYEKERERIAGRMTPAQIEEAGIIERQWLLGQVMPIASKTGSSIKQSSDRREAYASTAIKPNAVEAEAIFKSGCRRFPWRELTQRAERGDAHAQYCLGGMYVDGQGVRQDTHKGFEWLSRAAEQGHASAQYRLGHVYWWRLKDSWQATLWFHKAAEQGHVLAQNDLGYMYHMGNGVRQDYHQALYWYGRAAEQGDASSQYSVGKMYYQGEGVAQDYRQAAEWFHKAAEQEDIHSLYDLGVIYENGQGVAQDFKKAANWYRKAAERGRADAQFSLGRMYYEGQGVAQDIVLAYAFFNLAAENRNEKAIESRERVAKEMTGEQIKEGSAILSQWKHDEPLPTASKTGRTGFRKILQWFGF